MVHKPGEGGGVQYRMILALGHSVALDVHCVLVFWKGYGRGIGCFCLLQRFPELPRKVHSNGLMGAVAAVAASRAVQLCNFFLFTASCSLYTNMF